MQHYKAAARRLALMGLGYLVVIIVAGELHWRKGGGAMFFTYVWSAQLIFELWQARQASRLSRTA